MKISGFTIVRNGERFEYPYLESIRSLIPLVDEVVINVGRGDDKTLKEVQNLALNESSSQKKIIIFESEWALDDPEKKRDGKILSEQTNLSLERCTGDWCIYLQADEVLHEDDYEVLKTSLRTYWKNPKVEGLLFDYRHFYGSYDIVQHSRSSYRREVRAIKNGLQIQSVGDAQSFRHSTGRKIWVAHSNARIFHYGWVRSPDAMKKKTFFMDQLYHGDPSSEAAKEEIPHTGDNYRYKRFWGLRRFQETHPHVMSERIKNKGWKWDFENSPFVLNWKDSGKVRSDLFERFTGIRPFEYKSYRMFTRTD